MKLCNFFICLFMLPLCLFADAGDPQAAKPSVDFGDLQVSTLVVSDIEAAVAKWSAGTGTLFRPITTTKQIVFLSDGKPTQVTIKSTYSVYSYPFLELVEANPPVGPWAPQPDPSLGVGYQVYAVSNIHQADSKMQDAGLQKVAFSGNQFAFYKAANGLLIKVINKKLLPPAGGENISQAPIDLGPIVHTDLAIRDQDTLKEQLSQLFSIHWADFEFPDNRMTFPEGDRLVDVKVAVSDQLPQIQLEKITPPLGIFYSTLTSYNFHPAYVVPAGTSEAIRTQMEAAGFVLNTYVIVPDVGLVLSYYTGLENHWIEVVDERFDF